MYKRLLKDASLYSISSLLSRGLSLLTVPLFTRVLSPSDYGALDLLNTIMVFTPMLIGLALDQAVVRFYLDAKDELEKKRIASTVLFYNIFVFAALIPAVLPLTRWIADDWLAGQIDRFTAVMVFVYIWIHSLFIAGSNQLRYQFKSKQYAICHIGNVLLSTSLSVLFVFFMRMGIFGVILGQTIGQTVFGLLSIYYSRSSYSLLFHWPSLMRMLNYSLPLVPSTLSFYAMQYLDRVFLNDLKSLQEVGLYSIGARLSSLVSLFLMGFHGAWTPMVMKSFREEGAQEKFSTIFNYYIFATVMILAGLSLFSKEILILLTTEAFIDGYIVVPFLVASAVLASIAGYFTFGIQIKEKSNIRLIVNMLAVLVNCALNLLLIPSFGIIGAALATMSTFGFLAIVSMIISQRLYYVGYSWGRIFMAVLAGMAVAGFTVAVDVQTGVLIMAAKLAVLAGLLGLLAVILQVNVKQILADGFFARVTQKSKA